MWLCLPLPVDTQSIALQISCTCLDTVGQVFVVVINGVDLRLRSRTRSHIDSGYYREEPKTPETREITITHGIDAMLKQ